MAVLQGDGQNLPSQYVCYPKDPIWNKVKNGETLKVKRGCYTMKDIEKVSSGKVKYDSLTGKSIIDPTISRFGPYMNKILGISKRKLHRYTIIEKNVFI